MSKDTVETSWRVLRLNPEPTPTAFSREVWVRWRLLVSTSKVQAECQEFRVAEAVRGMSRITPCRDPLVLSVVEGSVESTVSSVESLCR